MTSSPAPSGPFRKTDREPRRESVRSGASCHSRMPATSAPRRSSARTTRVRSGATWAIPWAIISPSAAWRRAAHWTWLRTMVPPCSMRRSRGGRNARPMPLSPLRWRSVNGWVPSRRQISAPQRPSGFAARTRSRTAGSMSRRVISSRSWKLPGRSALGALRWVSTSRRMLSVSGTMVSAPSSSTASSSPTASSGPTSRAASGVLSSPPASIR